METLATAKQEILQELCSSIPSVWQCAIVGIAVCEGQIREDEVAIRVCFYLGGQQQ